VEKGKKPSDEGESSGARSHKKEENSSDDKGGGGGQILLRWGKVSKRVRQYRGRRDVIHTSGGGRVTLGEEIGFPGKKRKKGTQKIEK